MDTACKDTLIRSSMVPSAALYPKRHYHHRRYLTAFAKFCADRPSPRKRKKKKNPPEYAESIPLAFVSAVRMGRFSVLRERCDFQR